jgi:hypothetical protein
MPQPPQYAGNSYRPLPFDPPAPPPALMVIDVKTGKPLHPATWAIVGTGALLVYDHGWHVRNHGQYRVIRGEPFTPWPAD